ncbi:MAG: MFS transporter [Candidatus Hodarchaeales archaeon]|jgi:MFS family permease
MVINKYLGIEKIPNRAQEYFRSFLLIQSLSTFLLVLTSTFSVLYSIDNIGFTLTGITISFSFLIQLLFDYPSGSLGDWIGQRWVMTIAYICFGVQFFLMTSAQTFNDFMIIALFRGLGSAQLSGTMLTWFDNNYQKVVNDSDEDRKIYGFGRSRVLTMVRMASAISFILGGYMATTFTRQFVFGVQALSSIPLILVTLYFITDEKTVSEKLAEESGKTKESYLSHFIGGLSFLFSSKAPFFFLVGTALLFSSFTIWGTVILFPIYFGYSGTDGMASLLRTTIFALGVPISIYTAKFSKRFNVERVPLVTFLFVVLFYPGFMIITTIIPIENEFNLIGCLLSMVILTGVIPTIFDLGVILRQRIMLDLVPSKNRNAVYSLIPTIISLFGMVLLPISSYMIEQMNITIGIFTAFLVALLGAFLIMLGTRFHLAKDASLTSSSIQREEVLVTGP